MRCEDVTTPTSNVVSWNVKFIDVSEDPVVHSFIRDYILSRPSSL